MPSVAEPLTETLLKVTPLASIWALLMTTPAVVAAFVAPTVLFAFVAVMCRPLPEGEAQVLEQALKTLAVLFRVMAPLTFTVPPVPSIDTPAPPLLPMAPERPIVPP